MHPTLEQIYDAHADALYSFLTSCTSDHALVQDALQEVFLKLARTPSRLAQARDVRGYLLRSAHNALRDIVRRSSTRTVYEERHSVEAPSLLFPEFPSDEEAFRLAVDASLELIPQEQRSVLHLKLWENLTFAQIADTLEISPHTAASRYRYALDKLRALLRPVYEERH
jgi:RNA polymerase sigma-70 factor (ECF subfamily)